MNAPRPLWAHPSDGWLAFSVLCFCLAPALSGCNKQAEIEAAAAAAPGPVEEKLLQDGMIMQEIDLNKDHQPDVFNVFRERTNAPRILVRKEVDLNLDGRVDISSFFTDEGRIEREELDTDFDGKVDRIDHYQSQLRVMCEIDTNTNGAFDIFSYYEGNPPTITRKERDSDHDGRVDIWERFDDNGKVTKTGVDVDGDGKMDERGD